MARLSGVGVRFSAVKELQPYKGIQSCRQYGWYFVSLSLSLPVQTTDLLTQAMTELSQTLTTDYRTPQGDYQRIQYIPVSQSTTGLQQPQHIQLQVVQVAQVCNLLGDFVCFLTSHRKPVLPWGCSTGRFVREQLKIKREKFLAASAENLKYIFVLLVFFLGYLTSPVSALHSGRWTASWPPDIYPACHPGAAHPGRRAITHSSVIITGISLFSAQKTYYPESQ